MFGAINVAFVFEVGYRITFDGKTRTFTRSRLYSWEETWEADDLAGIVFILHKPDSPKCQGTQALVVDSNHRAVAAFGIHERRVCKAEKSVKLAQSVVHAATVLRLPLYLDVRAEPMCAKMNKALKLIESCRLCGPANDRPAARVPLLSHRGIQIFIVGCFIIGFARFMIVHLILK